MLIRAVNLKILKGEMEMKARKVLFFTLLALAITFAGTRAATSSVGKGPEPFLDEWDGAWTSHVYNINSSANLIISPPTDDGSLKITLSIVNPRLFSKTWIMTGMFKDGKVVVDRPSFKMDLHLDEKGNLEGTYDVIGSDSGSLYLIRKK